MTWERRECQHGKRKDACSICNPEGMFRQFERKAEARNLKFRLTIEEFIAVVNDQCKLCGAYPAGSVDRIHPKVGYLPDNVQPLCGYCNMLRGVRPYHELLNHLLKIARYQENKRRAIVPRQEIHDGNQTVQNLPN